MLDTDITKRKTMIKKESYFNKLIKGEHTLTITFWLWFIFISFLINVFIDNNFNEDFSFTIYFLTFSYSILIFLAVIRSASNYKGSKLWSILAKVLVTINLYFCLLTTYELLKVTYFEDYAIRSEINSFKDNLPIKVDSYSYLMDINIENKDISYVYQIDKVDISSVYNLNKFKKQVQNSLCEEENTLKLLKKDYILKYEYIDKNQNNIINIITEKSSCGKNRNINV